MILFEWLINLFSPYIVIVCGIDLQFLLALRLKMKFLRMDIIPWYTYMHWYICEYLILLMILMVINIISQADKRDVVGLQEQVTYYFWTWDPNA